LFLEMNDRKNKEILIVWWMRCLFKAIIWVTWSWFLDSCLWNVLKQIHESNHLHLIICMP
jgi:hypothetical protein